MLRIYPCLFSCEHSKSSKKKRRQSRFGGLRKLAAGGLRRAPGPWKAASLSPGGSARLQPWVPARRMPAPCYMWMCKLQQMMRLAIMFFAYISRNNSSQTANILLNSHRMTMCHTVTQQGAWK